MNQEMDTPKGEILVYQTADGAVKLDVRLIDETVWMTQADMALLFQCSADNISLHLKNIYDEGELERGATAEDFSVVRQEGKRQVKRKLTFYNLDMIISVGYRVKSLIATRDILLPKLISGELPIPDAEKLAKHLEQGNHRGLQEQGNHGGLPLRGH